MVGVKQQNLVLKKDFWDTTFFVMYMIGNIYFIHENSHEYARHMACMLQKYQFFSEFSKYR
jgi:hypothetical protein